MFADDLAINVICETNNTINMKVENISDKVKTWCSANNFSLNTNKTENINFNVGLSSTENSVRFLGIHLESGLGWLTHVNHIAKRISSSIFMLRILKKHVTIESLITVYYGHIHSHMNYGVLLWGNHTSAHHIFLLQKRAVRLIYGVTQTTHCKPLFIKSNILTLPSMFVLACLLHVKQNITKFTTCDSIHNYSTRNSYNLYVNKCKYTKTQKNFHIISINLFNHLAPEVKNLPYDAFKRRVRAALLAASLYKVEDFYHCTV